MDDLVQFLRDRYDHELRDLEGYDGSYNDMDGCWGQHVDPDFARADIEAKRQLLVDALKEPHFRNEEDHWYSCAALTDEGGHPLCFDEGRAPGPCDCGRDERVTRRLRLSASPYARHPDYRDDWRP